MREKWACTFPATGLPTLLIVSRFDCLAAKTVSCDWTTNLLIIPHNVVLRRSGIHSQGSIFFCSERMRVRGRFRSVSASSSSLFYSSSTNSCSTIRHPEGSRWSNPLQPRYTFTGETCSWPHFILADIVVMDGTAGAGRMAPPISTRIFARMKCVLGHLFHL